MWKHFYYSSVCVPPILQHLSTFVFLLFIHNPVSCWTHVCCGWGWIKAQSDLVTKIQETGESAHSLEPKISDPGCGQSQAGVAHTLIQSCASHSSPVQIQWEAGGLEMSIHPPRGTDMHNFHMISLLGTASQAAYKELLISLLVTKEPQKKNSWRNKHEDIYHPILNIILFLADDKLSFLSKASLNLTFTLSAPRAKFKSQFKQKHCKL